MLSVLTTRDLMVTPKRGNKGGPVLASLPGPAAEPEVLEGVTDEWTTAEENSFREAQHPRPRRSAPRLYHRSPRPP